MEIIATIKVVGDLQQVETKNHEVRVKRTLVVTSKETRSTDGNTYATENQFMFELWGDRAQNFPYQPDETLVIAYTSQVREYEGRYFAETVMGRCCRFFS